MDVRTLLGLASGFAAAAALAGWRGARPPDPFRGPRLIPWRMIMVFAAAAAVGLLGYGLRMLGINPPER